jgi:hypothetical protein
MKIYHLIVEVKRVLFICILGNIIHAFQIQVILFIEDLMVTKMKNSNN